MSYPPLSGTSASKSGYSPISVAWKSSSHRATTIRVKHQIESAVEAEEDEALKKKAKNLLKKLRRVEWGNEKLKIIIEDPSGNSAILSKKTETKKIRAAQESNA